MYGTYAYHVSGTGYSVKPGRDPQIRERDSYETVKSQGVFHGRTDYRGGDYGNPDCGNGTPVPEIC